MQAPRFGTFVEQPPAAAAGEIVRGRHGGRGRCGRDSEADESTHHVHLSGLAVIPPDRTGLMGLGVGAPLASRWGQMPEGVMFGVLGPLQIISRQGR
jgi:hypothetical protein